MKYATIAGRRYGEDIEDSFRIAAEIGFDGVEFPFLAQDYQTEMLWTVEGARRVRALGEQYGIAVPSCIGGRYNLRGFAAEDPEVREEAATVMLGLIDGCAEAGIQNILVAFFGQMAMDSDQKVQWGIEGVRRCAPHAEEKSVILALEGTVPAETWLRMIDAIGSDAVGVYYDVGNAVWLGFDGPAELRTLAAAGVLRQIHIKDMSLDKKNMPLGEGDVNWPAVADAIKDIGYEGWLALETPASGDPAVEQRTYLDFTKALVE